MKFVVFHFEVLCRGFEMLSFLRIKGLPRRRASASGIGAPIDDLEPRNLLSGATAPVAAVVGSADPQASQPPANFRGEWVINANPAITLTLTQHGKKVSGPLVGTGAIHFFFNSHGKVEGDFLALRGKGTTNGLKSKYSSGVVLTSLHDFGGKVVFETKGLPPSNQPISGFRLIVPMP